MASIFSTITVLNKLPEIKKVGGVIIDGLLEEVHIRKSNITKLPIEDGSIITDHITNEPDSITIKGVITNTPLFFTALAEGSVGALFGDRVTAGFEALDQLRKDKKLVTINTCLKLYTDMAIESLVQAKDETTGQSMNINMTLSHIVKVKNQVVSIPNSIIGGDADDKLQAENNASQGQTVGQTVDDDLTILADFAAQLGG